MKKKQVIRLTESDLHRIVENSVKRIITENEEDELFDWLRGAASKVGGDAARGMKQGATAAGNAVQGAAQSAAQGAQNAWNGAKSAVGNAWNGAKQGAQNAMNGAKSAVGNAANSVKQYGQSVAAAGRQASAQGDVNSAIKTINSLSSQGLINPNVAKQCIASMQKALAAKQF